MLNALHEISDASEAEPERFDAGLAIGFSTEEAADSDLSPERALEQLQRIQHHQVRISQAAKPINGISRLSEIHNRVFEALNLKKPNQPQQLSLL